MSTEQEPKPKMTIPLRTLLIDMVLIATVLVCLVAIRTMLVVEDEMHMFRSDAITQIIAARATLQTQGSAIEADLDKISVNSRVLTDRLDQQLTSARSELHTASEANQKSTATESKNIQTAITDNLAPATDSLVKMADKVDSATTEKPVVVTVPPATVVETPALPLASQAKTPELPALKEKKTNPVTRILVHVFMPWR